MRAARLNSFFQLQITYPIALHIRDSTLHFLQCPSRRPMGQGKRLRRHSLSPSCRPRHIIRRVLIGAAPLSCYCQAEPNLFFIHTIPQQESQAFLAKTACIPQKSIKSGSFPLPPVSNNIPLLYSFRLFSVSQVSGVPFFSVLFSVRRPLRPHLPCPPRADL